MSTDAEVTHEVQVRQEYPEATYEVRIWQEDRHWRWEVRCTGRGITRDLTPLNNNPHYGNVQTAWSEERARRRAEKVVSRDRARRLNVQRMREATWERA